MKEEERNKKIINMNIDGIKQIEISRIFSISRQRVSAIIKNRKCINKIDKIGRKQKFKCGYCGEVVLSGDRNYHHIDLDASNNSEDNFCVIHKKCHYELHKEINFLKNFISKFAFISIKYGLDIL